MVVDIETSAKFELLGNFGLRKRIEIQKIFFAKKANNVSLHGLVNSFYKVIVVHSKAGNEKFLILFLILF